VFTQDPHASRLTGARSPRSALAEYGLIEPAWWKSQISICCRLRIGVEVGVTLHHPGQIYAYPLCRRSSTDVGVRAGVLPSKSAGLLQDLIQRRGTTTSGFFIRTNTRRLRTRVRPLRKSGLPAKASCHVYDLTPEQRWGLARALKPLPSSTTVCGTAPFLT